jgi:predicted DNA-binding protein (MmcQ/YjbR family)
LTLEQFRQYCLTKPGVTEETPFGVDTLVMKVMGKIFAITDLNTFDGVNLKVEPEHGIELRERYTTVQPAYHMNKKHWVTVGMDGKVGDGLLKEWIDQSYALVVAKLTKSQRLALSRL